MSMIRCSRCVMPNTRPDTPFLDGVCQACLNYAARPAVDWHQRGIMLAELLDRHHGDCIVPSSGGKDSTYQAIKLKAMGANVTAVTARTCHLTPVGRRNIDNLARHVKTIEVVPNMTVRAKLNRLGLEKVGDISWPEHVAIFTTPFNVASALRCPLIMYGENPQDQYGGPVGSEQAYLMTTRWRSEFGGFLGMRPDDVVGELGITERDMEDYRIANPTSNSVAHFLGAYLPWDSRQNADVACAAGMQYKLPISSNWWEWENQDNATTSVHDLFGYLKYGYTRGDAQISVDIRSGGITREASLKWRAAHGQAYPHEYAGVSLAEMLDRIGVGRPWFDGQIRQWTNWGLFDERARDSEGLPCLKG